MKLVKSLLLGSAAGLTAIAGAQAADLPVRKAAPVEFVRVCTAYGAGYFYIPGTDTCLRVGGRARFEYHYQPTLNRNAGNGDVSGYRALGRLSLDARTATAYGTLRTFVRLDVANRSGVYLTSGTQQRFANSFPALGPDTFGRLQKFVDLDKAFVQFAGLTAGRAASFFDFYAGDFELIGSGTYSNASSTNLLAYTATFGQGFSATISVEDPTYRRTPIFGAGTTTTGGVFAASTAFNAFTGTTVLAPIYAVDAFGNRLDALNDVTQKNRLPDFVGALRYDAPWGSAQLSAAVHELNGGLTTSVVNPVTGAATALAPGLQVGRPRNEYGWAVQGGIKINTPFIAPGDALYLQGSYAEGANQYTGITSSYAGEALFAGVVNGQFSATIADAVLNPLSGRFDLTQTFSVAGAYLHYWSPEWRSAVFGSYAEERFSKGARAGLGLTGFGLPNTSTAAGAAAFALSPVLRDNSVLWVGANLIWSPVRDLDIGLEGVYERSALLNGRTVDLNKNPGYNGATGTGAVNAATINHADNALIRFRVQRDF